MEKFFDLDLPEWILQAGCHQLHIIDPRPQPEALGARYVHGGYIARWSYKGRTLTSQPFPRWSPYEGIGLPEVFEWGLGWAEAGIGDDFMRIGAGRMPRKSDENSSQGELTKHVVWELLDQSPSEISMRCHDAMTCGNLDFGYELQRQVSLSETTVISRTILRVDCPWNTPVSWFAHPFFRHSAASATRLRLPQPGWPIGKPNSLVQGHDFLQFEEASPAALARWGTDFQAHCPIQVDLDPSQGGGHIEVSMSRPLDHLVLFATANAFSPEPQWSRPWPAGDTMEWSIEYRYVDDLT